MCKRYFFFDIDGTLACGPYESRYIPESAMEALRQLRERGHFTAIATGRSHAMAMRFFTEGRFDNMVCDGGNGLVLDGTYLGTEPLERQPCIDLIDECERKGIPWAVSPDDSTRRIAKDGRFDASIDAGYMETVVDPGLDYRNVKDFYKVYVACEEIDEPNIEALAHVPHARQTKRCLFIEPVDKAHGILRVMDHFNAPLSDVVVFGDGTNDLTMFDKRWLSIAMGNARGVLKEKADYITTDVDKDGIYNACRHFGWID